MRCKQNKATAIFYQTGEHVCFGGKTRDEARKINKANRQKSAKTGKS